MTIQIVRKHDKYFIRSKWLWFWSYLGIGGFPSHESFSFCQESATVFKSYADAKEKVNEIEQDIVLSIARGGAPLIVEDELEV